MYKNFKNKLKSRKLSSPNVFEPTKKLQILYQLLVGEDITNNNFFLINKYQHIKYINLI